MSDLENRCLNMLNSSLSRQFLTLKRAKSIQPYELNLSLLDIYAACGPNFHPGRTDIVTQLAETPHITLSGLQVADAPKPVPWRRHAESATYHGRAPSRARTLLLAGSK